MGIACPHVKLALAELVVCLHRGGLGDLGIRSAIPACAGVDKLYRCSPDMRRQWEAARALNSDIGGERPAVCHMAPGLAF